MKQYVIGYKAPRFVIKSGNEIIETIEFDFVGSEGLSAYYEPDAIVHKNLKGNLIVKPRGFHIYYTIDYKEYSPLVNSFKVKSLFNHYLNNHTLILYPRKENLIYSQIVTWDDGFEIGNRKHGAEAIGNKGIELKLRTVDMQYNLNWTDPNYSNFIATEFAVC